MTKQASNLEKAARKYAKSKDPHDLETLAALAIPVAMDMAAQIGTRVGIHQSSLFDRDQIALDGIYDATRSFAVKPGGRTTFGGLLWRVISRRCTDSRRTIYGRKHRKKKKPTTLSIERILEKTRQAGADMNNPQGPMDFLGLCYEEPKLADRTLELVYALDLSNKEKAVVRAMLKTHCDAAAAGKLLGVTDFAVWVHMRAIKKKAKEKQDDA